MMRRSPRARRARPAEAGISYAEVLVTLLLLALVVGALLPLLTSGQQGYEYATRRQQMIQNARVALDQLVRQLRAAESFRSIGPTLLSFNLFWGDGSGAVPTVEYSIGGGAASTLQYRWSANWDFREQVTVRAQDAVAAGYATALTFDHASLVGAGKSLASGDDVRVWYWNGSAMIELDRVLDPTSSWNTGTTAIWFPLQAPIAAGGVDANYYLCYGNLADAGPPVNGQNVFLDFQDGTALDGWTRRDAHPGAYAASAANGFVFQASSGTGYRELTKNVPHSDVEIFWGFWSAAADAANGHQAGVSARLSDTGVGYRVNAADQNNSRLRIRYTTAWGGTGTVIGSANLATIPGTSYFGRFYLVGSSIRVKYWPVGTPEPAGWLLSVTDVRRSSGNHYGLVDGSSAPEDHAHRALIVRPRVALEPTTTLGAEVSGARPDQPAALAGPFRSMGVTCYDDSGASIACTPTTPVRVIQVSLVVMDPAGQVPDITVTGRAFRESP